MRREGNTPENQLVLMIKDFVNQTTGATTRRLGVLSHPELQDAMAKHTPQEQRLIAAGAMARLRGETPLGAHAGVSDELATWLVHTEGRRDPAALVTNALALDMVSAPGSAARMPRVLRRLPMRVLGAQAISRVGSRRISRDDAYFARMGKKAWAEVSRRFETVAKWVKRLDVLTAEDKDAHDVEERLKVRIRDRVFDIYGLTPEERSQVMGRLGGP